MVTADVLEGVAFEQLAVEYCRRCGAVRVARGARVGEWRLPDPRLWKG
jgi:hypothetical protein